jgi:magnesium-transporting ATPase (P-type)
MPNPNLEKWDGNVYSKQLQKTTNIEMKNLLLRGCTLKNSEYAFGIATYLGSETKIFMNARKSPRKVSALMKLMNKMLYTVFAFQITIIVVFSSVSV